MKRSPSSRAIAALTLVSFIAGLAPRPAHAQAEAASPPEEGTSHPTQTPDPPVNSIAARADVSVDHTAPELPREMPKSDIPIVSERPAAPSQGGASTRNSALVPDSLPTGVDTTGVSSQVLSLPQGAGKIQGMGESFSNQLSTGTGSFSIPISLPGARGGADPSLALSYSTSSGHGIVGVGWDIGVPFISRQTDRGSPHYQDPSAGTSWLPTQDRFVFNGGQELVPICLVQNGACPASGQATGALTNEAMPSWASGWQYFRPRIEGSFLRIFWSPNHQTWRVQDKNGESMELGVPLDGSTATGTIETNPEAPGQIYRWNLSRQYDAYGLANPASGATPLPVNVTRYLYTVNEGMSYLTDVYDTPPASNAATADVSTYAHHARLLYATRPDVTTSYRRGWAASQGLRLTGIDVTSKTFQDGPSGTRRLVRRYHLGYDASYHVSLLTSVQVEGRCGTPTDGEESEPVTEDGTGALPATTGCPMLPAMTFGYTHVTPYNVDGSAGAADLTGYEGFDARVTTMTDSPPHSVDEADTDLFDVNADGLPDVLVTLPALYGGNHGIYLNSSATGIPNSFSAGTMGVQGVLGENTTDITLDNPNISSGDLDGDGKIDLVNMPQVETYSVYTPEPQGTGFVWQGRQVTTAPNQSPKIDFSGNAVNVQRMDVNGDGLVDVVVTEGTEVDTFLSLDRYPGGDGQFGSATWTGPTTATISNAPIASCVPWDGLPVAFSDSTIKIADMNGDGLPDIVRMEQGNIHYWPGRGNGYWGTGNPSSCPAGTFGENQSIAMTKSPEYQDPNGSALRIDDVNGDGLDDAVEVNFTEVNIWLNVDGAGWIGPHVIENAPASPAYQSRVRLVDMNGSGTRDILWGDAGAYKFMDLSGGARPWMLTHVGNGLGKTTDLTFASSVSLMLAATTAKSGWASVTPSPMEVVTSMTVNDNLPVAASAAGSYVTQYTYRDPVYDGLQREFRGFTTATERQVGDTNSPSSSAQSEFLLGTCEDDEPLDGLPSACTFQGRWRDNVREALKGLPQSVQTFDDNGNYQSSVHHTYRLRKLYLGLDGREVRHAFASGSDTYLYDTWTGDTTASSVTTDDVELELTPPAYSTSESTTAAAPIAAQQSGTFALHGTVGRVHLQTRADVDVFGNTYHAIDSGCVEGCVAGEDLLSTQATTDEVITQYAQPTEISVLAGGNYAGWTWRNTQTFTQGSNDTFNRNLQKQTFDGAGSPLVTTRELGGPSLVLLRQRIGTGPYPPEDPPGASTPGWITPLVVSYDPFGNAVTSVAPNGRCRTTIFDPSFATLPASDTVYVGAAGPSLGIPGATACGATPLTATATVYDRGLSAIKTLTDVHQEQTTINYDGFGRIVEMYRPDPTTGQPGGTASMAVDYELPTNASATPYSRVHTEVQDGSDPTVASYRESWAYVDGLGRTRVTFGQADPVADTAAWVESGLTTYDGKGAKNFTYLDSFYAQDASTFDPTSPAPAAPYTRVVYDAFSRATQSYNLDQTPALFSYYHALSVDAWDAADLGSSAHAGSFATSAKDGHGRAASVTERNHVNGVLQSYQTTTTHLSTGEPSAITRTNLATNAQVVRTMEYDSLGRMIQNIEPDTSAGSAKSWRYAYNDNGDLVGMSDARWCGANYAYDAGGRIIGEDYAPCTTDQAAYTSVSGTAGYEVSYFYDAPDSATQSPGIPGLTAPAQWFAGRLSSVSDRSGRTVNAYDGRGRTTGIARQLVAPNGALTPRWYVQTSAYDAADRLVTETTGAADSVAVLEDGGASPLDVTSTVTTTFSKRSLVKSVTSDHGDVIARVTHDADGLPLTIVYGDTASTTTTMTYTPRRQISTVLTSRGPSALWAVARGTYVPPPASGGPSTLQSNLANLTYQYDEVDNPIEIDDGRSPTEWPVGAKPAGRTMQYDDLYRLTQINYGSGKSDPWTPPFAAEDDDDGIDPDPQRATPSPQVSFTSRILQQTFAYDWLGNTTQTNDDANGFYDRSLGAITNGTATAGPYQIQSAGLSQTVLTHAGIGSQTDGGLSAAYDVAGNMTSLAVTRTGKCLPAGAVCSQRFAYSWDEVGRLARARRWDTASPGAASSALPTTTPAADLQYTYDATDDRAIKAAYDGAGNVRYAVYPLDPFELRGATWDETSGDYERSTATQVGYVFARGVRLGRIAQDEADPSLNGITSHLLLELADHLGSTMTVIDQATSELVEEGTYQAYGGAESDYRPQRWDSFREDYRFTGKEEDVEVGLQYFGKRYYAPGLGRWINPDPLALQNVATVTHTARGDTLNLYEYVCGNVYTSRDEAGLEGERLPNPTLPLVPEPAPEPPRRPVMPSGRWLTLGIRNLPETITDPKQLPRLSTIVIQAPGAPPGGYVIAPYSRRLPQDESESEPDVETEKHHAFLSEMNRFYVYRYSESAAPTIRMTKAQHRETVELWNAARRELIARGELPTVGNKGRRIDWSLVPEGFARMISTEIMNSIPHPVPKEVQEAYWKEMDVYKENQEFNRNFDEFLQQEQEYQQHFSEITEPPARQPE